jgi:MFS family permease
MFPSESEAQNRCMERVSDAGTADARAGGAGSTLDLRAFVPIAVLAFTQDAITALVFLSYMNHYLLVVLHASPGLPGYTLALYGATKLLVLPISGRLADRKAPRAMLAAALCAQLGAAALLLLVSTLPAFLIATVLLAVGSGCVWPLLYAILARTQPADAHGRATGILAIVGYGATALGFLFGVLSGRFLRHRSPFIVLTVLLVLPMVLERALGCGRPGDASRGTQPAVEPPHPAETASPAGHRKGFARFGLIAFLDFAALSALAGIYGPFSRLTLGIGLFRTSIVLAPAALVALASLAITSRHSREGRRMVEMQRLYALAAVGTLVVAVAPNLAWAAAGAVLLGAGAGGIAPVIAATLLEFGRHDQGGRALGMLMAIEGVGTVVGPGCAGLATDLGSPRYGMILISVMFAGLVALTTAGARSGVAPSPATARQAEPSVAS